MKARLCTSTFVINDLPAGKRQFLSRKSVQDEICKFADVEIYTRGHYKPRRDNIHSLDNRPPLSLHIVGANESCVKLANQKIQSLLMNPQPHDYEEEEMSDIEKITVGIDVFPLIFGMKTKILGENNENAEYILNETGNIMTLRGKGSGFIDSRGKKDVDEPLHVHIRYKNMDSRERTRELILNLIETVQQDFINSSYGKFYSPPRKPEIITVPFENIRRTSSYNSLSSRSPVRNIDRSIDRRSMEKHGYDKRSPPDSRPYDNRPVDSKPFEKRSSLEPRPYDRSIEPRPFEKRSSVEPRPYENRSIEPRPFEKRSSVEPRPYDNRPAESRPYDKRPPEPRPFENRPLETRNLESRSFSGRPEPRFVDNRAPESRPINDRPSEAKPFPTSYPDLNPFKGRSAEPKPYEKRTRESRFEAVPVEPVPPPESRSDRRSVENPLPDSTKPSPVESSSSNIEKVTIGIESVPPAFNLKSKIYGTNLANVKHIEKVASALLLVEGKGCGGNSANEEAQEPPYILVKYLKPELKETARNLIFNLIDTIQQEYIALYGRYPGGPQKPQIVPIKKIISDKSSAPEPAKIKPIIDSTPVPPPPPVISKNTSPTDRFEIVPPPAYFGNTLLKPSSPKLFPSAEPTPVPRPVQPVIPSTTSNSFDPKPFRLPDPEPLPVSAPLSGIGSQSSILNSVLSSQPSAMQSFSFASLDPPATQIQTIQHSEKRPKSPASSSAATDAKRFCGAGGVNNVNIFDSTIPPPSLSVPTSQPAPVPSSQQIQRAPNPASAKSKNPFRNLIPITVNSKPAPPQSTTVGVGTNTAATAAKNIPLKPVPPPTPVPAPIRALAQAAAANKKPPTPVPAPAGILKNSQSQWTTELHNGGSNRDQSEGEGRISSNPIILSDSDDEEMNGHRNPLRISASVSKPGARDISAQTDDKLYQTQIKNIKCACGRFMHVVTGVRSVETQTIGGDSYRRY